jgi:hypothetical protein
MRADDYRSRPSVGLTVAPQECNHAARKSDMHILPDLNARMSMFAPEGLFNEHTTLAARSLSPVCQLSMHQESRIRSTQRRVQMHAALLSRPDTSPLQVSQPNSHHPPSTMDTIEADYLVIGAGAMGMAFVDTILSDTDRTIAIVDRYARPSGHWTVAYPYVRLHQPSAFYGVNSRNLGQNQVDQVGWNKGLGELASRDEVCSYYDGLMHQTFLPSGHVTYYPKHEYTGEGVFKSILTGKAYRAGSNTCIVDATFMKVKVPSMSPPAYGVASGVQLVTPNDLPSMQRQYGNYTVVGAGKTGIDACLWLLANGIDPSSITWIMPRDSFYMERSTIQPRSLVADNAGPRLEAANHSIMAASSVDDLMDRLIASQQLLRLDDGVTPTMFRCATVSLAEFEQLKKIQSIVRKGRVTHISQQEVTLQRGSYSPVHDTLFIDCSADGLAKLTPVPVFQKNLITLQSVRWCQQVFSAAFIAHVEATYSDSQTKNDLTRVIPHPNEVMDYPLALLQSHLNNLRWNSRPATHKWLQEARLDYFRALAPPVPADPIAAEDYFEKVGAQIMALCAKLRELLLAMPAEDAERARVQLEGFDESLRSNL